MIFNDSEAVKDFKTSNDFQTVMPASSDFNTKDTKQVLFAAVFQSPALGFIGRLFVYLPRR